jgi:hypothetical protein
LPQFHKLIFLLLLQYGNLDHLRINDGDMSLVQYLSIDVVIALVLLLLLVPAVPLLIIRYLHLMLNLDASTQYCSSEAKDFIYSAVNTRLRLHLRVRG